MDSHCAGGGSSLTGNAMDFHVLNSYYGLRSKADRVKFFPGVYLQIRIHIFASDAFVGYTRSNFHSLAIITVAECRHLTNSDPNSEQLIP